MDSRDVDGRGPGTSIAWYQEWCELKLVLDRRANETVWLAPADRTEDPPLFVLVLTQAPDVGPVNHLGFEVDSREKVDALAKRASPSSLLFGPHQAAHPVGYFCQVRDPDGHIIEFEIELPIAVGVPELRHVHACLLNRKRERRTERAVAIQAKPCS